VGNGTLAKSPKLPRPSSTYMKARLSRGVSAVFSDLDSSFFLSDRRERSSPAAAKRCAEGVGLEGALLSETSSKGSQILLRQVLLGLVLFPIQGEPFACVRRSRGTNLYPAGYNPSQGPSCALRGRGLRGRWDHSLPRRLSAMSRSGHTSTLDFISSCYRCWVSLPFENGASRNQASFKITP
jgi:hypothetical protein